MLRLFLALFLAVSCWLPAVAEEMPEPPPVETRTIDRLRALSPALEVAENQLEELRDQLGNAVTDAERAEIAAELDAQRKRVAELRDDFRTVAAGVEEGRFLGTTAEQASWDENLRDIIEPISRTMREMTAGPREMDELRGELIRWTERRELSQAALERVEELLGVTESPSIREELEATRRVWTNRLTEAESRIQVHSQQIEERRRTSPSTWGAISNFFAEFWQSKGLNILLALASMIFVFVVVRRIYRVLRRFSPIHRKGGNNLAARSSDLMVDIFAVLMALLTAVLVFYLRGDWLLLALSIVALLGIAWASKTAVPPYLEQIRLMLNIGPVRQGERIIIKDLQWRVDKLAFYCEFRNPELEGGLIRLPIREVMPLYSRPCGPKEPWFPTHENDWVIVGDGTYGKVVHQTPDQVIVLRLGGSRKTYPTADFLAATPENLSVGFRISMNFGIDYMHQEICTTEVPAVFRAALERRLTETVGRDNLRSVKVEFALAGASSLDYEILADFDGEVASRRNVLERLIQTVCVDVCNERGWVIPFTQVTVHKAPDPQLGAAIAALSDS